MDQQQKRSAFDRFLDQVVARLEEIADEEARKTVVPGKARKDDEAAGTAHRQ
jgi:hypothetical protein